MRHILACVLLLPLLASCGEREVTFWPTRLVRAEGRVDGAGERTGEWRFFYREGRLRERGSFREGLPTGTWTRWYTNSQRAETGTRTPAADGTHSPRTGTWRFWHESGFVSAEGEFDATGRRTGEWRFYGPEGAPDASRSGRYVEGVRQP